MSGLAVDGVIAAVHEQIFLGQVRPGQHLDEASLGRSLDVSRNTLREAFRVLAQQRLVVHEPNRGVFVRRIDVASGHEIYAARRFVQCGALREAAVKRAAVGRSATSGSATPASDLEWGNRLAAVRAAVERGLVAAEAGEWVEVGNANSRFHIALTALAGNAVVDRIVGQLLTEMRLMFLDVATPEVVHSHYLPVNERIASLVEADELVRAAVVLEDYLLGAERDLVGRLAGQA